jgi:hypothetical protein
MKIQYIDHYYEVVMHEDYSDFIPRKDDYVNIPGCDQYLIKRVVWNIADKVIYVYVGSEDRQMQETVTTEPNKRLITEIKKTADDALDRATKNFHTIKNLKEQIKLKRKNDER